MYRHYELIKKEAIKSLNGEGIHLLHPKSGAKIFIIKANDTNKVFNIGFRTPPPDDTGLPHILEHSVLCGSRKYPVKDPFVELAKGSLNTFLNAMTYSDKTIYPVASCNDKDFRNLTDVYLDAVFYPNIYKEPRILLQEGWHYELESEDGEIFYNGVVFNEMKGASSSPEQILFRQIQNVLFPNNPYGNDSGGDPVAIVDLSLNQFLDFHKTYYHPSNSYIYFYGDIDVEDQLDWLHESYLKDFDAIKVPSDLVPVPKFESPVHANRKYAVSKDAETDKKTYLSYNVAFDQPTKPCESLGLEILEYLLLEAPGAPLKEALTALDIAEDIFGSYDSGLNQPTFSIIAKNANPEDEGLFIETIEKTLGEIAENGLPRRKIEAAINYFDFKTREADFGQYPKGIIYAIKALETWLYDKDPFENFDYEGAFKALREGLSDGCFQGLIRKYLLGNTHLAYLQLIPDKNLLEEKEGILKEKIKAYEATLTADDRRQLVEDTLAFKKYQETPNSPEELQTIPLLELSDIDEDGKKTSYDVVYHDGVDYILHKTFTGNIAYVRYLFDLSPLALNDVPKAGLLVKLLGKLDTNLYTYSELSDEINIHTGGIKTSINIYGQNGDANSCQPRLEIKFKCFSEKIGEATALVHNLLTGTLFEDEKRIKDLLFENKSRMAMTLQSAGHSASMNRAFSYHTIQGKYRDLVEGIGYYRYLEEAVNQDGMTLAAEIRNVLKTLVHGKRVQVLINTEEKVMDAVKKVVQDKIDTLPQENDRYQEEEEIFFEALNEGFTTASKVQYCALSGDYIEAGYTYSGAMRVLQTILSLDYMWTEVRIKGGAYGGFAGFRRSGLFYLGSYRDPNLDKTFETYEKLPAYIRALDLDSRELTKYIIGTMSNVDTPMTPQMEGDKALSSYLSGISYEDEQQERSEILNVSLDQLKGLADMAEAVIDQGNRCVIGNETKITSEQTYLNHIEPLNL